MPTISYAIDAPAFDLNDDATATDVIDAYNAFIATLDLPFIAVAIAATPSDDYSFTSGEYVITLRTTNLNDFCDAIDIDIDTVNRIV